METTCIMCTLPMINEAGEPEPTITLMCNHTAHTLCFMRHAATRNLYLHNMNCHECDTPVVPMDIVLEAQALNHPNNEAQIVKFMWETEPDFKNDLKTLRKFQANIGKSSSALKSKHKAILAQHKEDIDVHVQIIKYKVEEAQKKYKTCEEYKTISKLMSVYSTAYMKFVKRWGVEGWTIRHVLRNIQGAKSLVPNTPRHNLYQYKHGLYKFGVRIR